MMIDNGKSIIFARYDADAKAHFIFDRFDRRMINVAAMQGFLNSYYRRTYHTG